MIRIATLKMENMDEGIPRPSQLYHLRRDKFMIDFIFQMM
jgi:hypothetical protein